MARGVMSYLLSNPFTCLCLLRSRSWPSWLENVFLLFSMIALLCSALPLSQTHILQTAVFPTTVDLNWFCFRNQILHLTSVVDPTNKKVWGLKKVSYAHHRAGFT